MYVAHHEVRIEPNYVYSDYCLGKIFPIKTIFFQKYFFLIIGVKSFS
jgi:hypothetical protein